MAIQRSPSMTRRRLLQLGAALPVAGLAACALPRPSPSPSANAGPSGPSAASPVVDPSASASAIPTARRTPPPSSGRRVLYRDAAFADGRGPSLRIGISVLVADGMVAWIRPSDGEEDRGDARVIDASGATIVPGLVDCHAHVTGPGGAHWIERFSDDPARLVEVADENGALALGAGVRWLRDVGSPLGVDPTDGRQRALALGVRERWVGRRDRPYLRAAGSWLFKRGASPIPQAVEAANGDELLAAAVSQLDAGADLVKLYMDGPDATVSPWTEHEVARVVAAVHARGARVTAHAGRRAGVHEAVAGGVDSIEHGFELDASLAAEMAAAGTTLVSTLAVLRSWQTFGRTTRQSRFASADGRTRIAERREAAEAAVAAARRAGVAICAGTDFGGGSLRANHLAWEVQAQVDAGLEPWEALAAATWRGGELLREEDAGVIREGGPADFFLVHGDPLSEPAALWRVWRRAWED